MDQVQWEADCEACGELLEEGTEAVFDEDFEGYVCQDCRGAVVRGLGSVQRFPDCE